MPKRYHRWVGLGTLLAALVGAGVGRACSVPVFRYALERWTPDAYEVVIFHREAFNSAQKDLIEALEKVARDGLANCATETVNVAEPLSGARQALWQAQSNAALPWMVVRYPPAKEISASAWEGPFNKESVRLVLNSPARQELTKRLGQGATAVWLLLEPTGAKRADAVFQMMEEESRKLEKTLKLPQPDPDDPPPRSDVPLKIAFSTLRVSRSDPAEQGLVSMLLRPDKDLLATNEPMMFTVFGRGRAMPPIVGKELRAPILAEVADFVAGPCSCQVKEMNPGLDLLTVADWETMVGGGRVVKEPEIPALIGLSQFAATAPAPAVTNASTNVLAPAMPETTNAAGSGVSRGSLASNLLFVFGVGCVFLVVATFAIRARFKPPAN